MRSVCAAALLGSCGLLVPAASAQIPDIDAFILRTFASDSPIEGRSGFATEMREMCYVLDDVSPRSLVLVDELGKGSEVQAGTAIAGAVFESICDKECFGIFATHLHFLFQLPLIEKNFRCKMFLISWWTVVVFQHISGLAELLILVRSERILKPAMHATANCVREMLGRYWRCVDVYSRETYTDIY